jgi:anti-sigma factor RsiW
MNCERVRPSLASYAGGELGSETTAWVDSHLSSCSACSAIVARHRQIGAALTQVALREIEPPASLVPEVMARVGRSRRIIPVPIPPPPELVRAFQENREQIVSTTGTVLAAGAAAWLLYKAAMSVRDATKPKPGLA